MKRLAFILFYLAASAAASYGKMVEVSNDTVRIGVDDSTSRFWMETLEGELGNSKDNNAQLIYKKTPLTSFTTLNIDGQNVIFGGDNGNYIKRAYIDGKKVITGWEFNGVLIVQETGIVNGKSTGLADTMFITYKINNKSGKKIKAGIRILLDVMTGNSKPKGFGVPGLGTITRETQLFRDVIPPFWYIFDNYENPVIRAQGTLTGAGNTKPDRVVFSSWDRFYDNPWDFAIDGKRELRRLASPEFDSAAAVYYEPVDLEKEQTLMVSTSFGLYGTSIFTDKDMLLSLTIPNDPGHPPVPVSAQFKNQGKAMLDRLQMEIILPKGFKLAANESNIISFVKVATNQEYPAYWNLTSGSIGGNFKVKVVATAWNEGQTNAIVSEQNFNINYVENPIPTNTVKKPEVKPVPVPVPKPAPVPTPIPVVVTPQLVTNTVLITNQMVVVEEIANEVDISPEEQQLIKEIRSLDKDIDEINKKYQVLMGIYKNVYKPNDKFLDDVDQDLIRYQNNLKEQESILSNERLLLKDD